MNEVTVISVLSTLVAKVDEISAQIEGDWLAYKVVTEASYYFRECPEDFCLQTVGSTVVFGGTNRLIWSARSGFYCDPSYCSRNFLEHAAKIRQQKI